MTDHRQLDFSFKGNLGHPDRSPDHERLEREAIEMGIPYLEPIRTLKCKIDGIEFRIIDAIMSWRVEQNDILYCVRCGSDLHLIGPNLLHPTSLFAQCACGAYAFLNPVDERNCGLLELICPISEDDQRIGEDFHRHLQRLTAAK